MSANTTITCDFISEQLIGIDQNFLSIFGPIYRNKRAVRKRFKLHVMIMVSKLFEAQGWTGRFSAKDPDFEIVLFHGVKVIFRYFLVFLFQLV